MKPKTEEFVNNKSVTAAIKITEFMAQKIHGRPLLLTQSVVLAYERIYHPMGGGDSRVAKVECRFTDLKDEGSREILTAIAWVDIFSYIEMWIPGGYQYIQLRSETFTKTSPIYQIHFKNHRQWINSRVEVEKLSRKKSLPVIRDKNMSVTCIFTRITTYGPYWRETEL